MTRQYYDKTIIAFMNGFHIVLALLVLLSGSEVFASETNILLIVDASGSMRARIEGTSKMDIAKEVVSTYVSTIPPTTNVGLIAYGHRNKKDCNDVQYLVPVGKNNRKQLVSSLRALTPKGKTPIAVSLDKAVYITDKLPGNTTIILVSDGRESCQADPCALIERYIAEGKTFISHVIGFDVDIRARKQLECIAAAGKGTYFPADDINGLTIAFEDVTKSIPVAVVEPKKQRTSHPRPIKLKSGTLSLQKTQFIAGERIWVHYNTPDIYDEKAWIGIVPSNIPHGSENRNDKHDLTYKYLRGRQTDDLEFFAPGTPGMYDFRMHDTDRNGIEVAHVSFEVIRGSASISLSKTELTSGEPFEVSFETFVTMSPKAWVGIVPSNIPHGSEDINDKHDLSYKYLGKHRNGTLKFIAPATPGAYDMRLHDTDSHGTEIASVSFTVSRGSGTITLNKSAFQTGEAIIVKFSTSARLDKNAWIGIVPSDIPHGSESRNDKFDLAYKYLNGETIGERDFVAPSTPGNYDFRLNDSNNNGNELTYVSFTVTEATGSISLKKHRYTPGETIWVTFKTSVAFPKNAWVGIIPSNIPHGEESRNDKFDLSHKYLSGKQQGILEFKAPDKQGSYDFRMHDTDSNGREVSSVSFTVH